MPRTIVYPPRATDGGGAGVATGDGYGQKIAKYVPAEVIGPFLPLVLLAEGQGKVWVIICFIAGFLATPLYLFLAGQNQTPAQRPRPYFYLLATIAFVTWALGTSNPIANLFTLNPSAGTLILGLAVFLIPGIDAFCTWAEW